MEKGLHIMRDIAKETQKHGHVQEALAKALKLLCAGEMHLSVKESQKWSSILLPWVCGNFSSDNLRGSATNILSYILETYGPLSIPISQGWLAVILKEILASNKTTSKGDSQPKSDKVKTNLTQWSGATLPLQYGGLVVKQMLHHAKQENLEQFVDNTVGVVFYSCPHFGSRLADMPWRMGLVLRPAPSIGELRSGCARLVELNDHVHQLHSKGRLEVLSFCETKVTPIVEGYGGWAFRMEIVPLESSYPGFGEIVVLDSTDHINSCKPMSRSDPSYKS
ncbi:hypothetical protein MKX01_034338 [Papaver californicum]|nr:hypothetical protein MKX01_034338 [Papaver californicum]